MENLKGNNQTNKQEMAKWLAEKVLNWTYESLPQTDAVGNTGTYYDAKKKKYYFNKTSLTEHIYSPDGFFEVWDEVVKIPYDIDIGYSTLSELWEVDIYIAGEGPSASGHRTDRFEVFYSAVYEALK